jgi:hypothetical protein
MAQNDRIVNAANSASPTLTGITAGNDGLGNTQLMSQVQTGTLSANTDFTANTSTMTMTPVWQVSTDGTNWRDAFIENDAAFVVQATGTAAISKRAVSAPTAVYGFRYARLNCRIGVATAGASDLAVISYNYVIAEGF